MFVDIDRDDAGGSVAQALSGLRSLFGRAAPQPATRESPVVTDIRRLAEANSVAARVYRTAAGYRLIVTSVRAEAGSPASERLLEAFGADPLYVRLCRLQQSYRARLTPKPWRCGLGAPPVSFPFETPEDEARFRSWESAYASATARRATCRYVTAFGESTLTPDLDALVRFHDDETKAATELPLA
jgi:hypothetical protein